MAADINFKVGIDGTDANSKINDISRKAEELSKSLNKTNKINVDTKEAEAKIGALPGIIQKSLDSSNFKGINMAGIFNVNQLQTAVANAANVLAPMLNISMEYEKKLAAVGAFTGLTGDALDKLGSKARDLAKSFGTDATTQLTSFEGILSKFGMNYGQNADALEKLTTNINTLAKAGGIDAATAMDALTNSMLQFGLRTGDPMKDAETSTKIINILAASARVGAAQIPQVSEAILQVGGAAKGANLSIADTAAAIQVLAVGGKTGAEAGTALRNVLGLLQRPSAEAEQAFLKMGLTSRQVATALTEKGLGSAVELLQTGFGKLGSDADKNAAKMKIFGMENAQAATVLIDNIGRYKEFQDGIRDGQQGVGTAFEMAAQKGDTAAGKINKMKAYIQDMYLGIGKTIGQMGTVVLKTATDIAPMILSVANIKNIIPAGAFESVGKFTKDILTKLVPSLFVTQAAAAETAMVFDTTTMQMVAANATASESAVATSFSFSALWSAITGPIGLVILAIAAIGAGLYLLYQNSESFRDAINSVWEVIKNAGAAIWDGILAGWNVIKPTILAIGDFFQGVLGVAIAAIILLFKAMWEIVKLVFAVTLKPLIDSAVAIFNWLVKAVQDVYNWFVKLSSGVSEFSQKSSFLNGVISVLTTIFKLLIAPIYAGYQAIKLIIEGFQKAGNVGNLVKGILSGLSAAWSAFAQGISDIWNSIVNLDFGKLSDTVSNLTNKVKDAFTGGFDAKVAAEKGKEVGAALNTAMQEEVKKTGKTAAELIADYLETAKSAVDKLKSDAASGLDTKQLKVDAKAARAEINKILLEGSGASKDQRDAALLLKKEVDDVFKKTKGEKEHKAAILDSYESQKKKNTSDLENLKLQAEIKATKDGQSLTDAQQLQFAKLNLDNKNKELETLQNILKEKNAIVNADGSIKFTTQSKLSSEEKNKLIDAYATAQKEISAADLAKIKLEVTLTQKNEKIKEDLEKIQLQMERTQLEYDVKLGIKTDSDLYALTQKELYSQIDNLSVKLNIETDPVKLAEYEKQMKELALNVSENYGKLTDADEKQRLNNIQDNYKREYAITLASAKKTYEDKRKAAQGSQALELQAYDDFLSAKLKADQNYNDKTNSLLSSLSKEFASNLGTAFNSIDYTLPSVSADDANKKYDNEKEALQKSLAAQEVSITSYQNKLKELDAKRNEDINKNVEYQKTIWSQFGDALSNVFKKSYDNILKYQEEMVQKQIENSQKLNIANVQLSLSGNESMQEIDDRRLQATKDGNKELATQYSEVMKLKQSDANKTSDIIQSAGLAFVAMNSQMIASNKWTFKNFLTGLLKTVTAAVNAWLAVAFAQELASKSFAGFATFALISMAVNAALAGASALITKAFLVGGIDKTGSLYQNTVNGILTKPLTVITAVENGKSEGVLRAGVTAGSEEDILDINRQNISMRKWAWNVTRPEILELHKKINQIERNRSNERIIIDNSDVIKRLDNIESAVLNGNVKNIETRLVVEHVYDGDAFLKSKQLEQRKTFSRS